MREDDTGVVTLIKTLPLPLTNFTMMFKISAIVASLFAAVILIERSNAFAPDHATRISFRTSHIVPSSGCDGSSPSTTSTFFQSSVNDQLSDVQEKFGTFVENLLDSIKIRYGIFNKALTEDKYNFKQSMAITIAGEYDEEQVQQQINDIVQSNPCVMFVWEASPSCKKAVEAFERMGFDQCIVNVKIVRLDDPWSEGNKIRAELGKMTGKSSVPSIWIGGKYVGGYDAGISDEAPGIVTMAFQGTLRPMLEKAGAMV